MTHKIKTNICFQSFVIKPGSTGDSLTSFLHREDWPLAQKNAAAEVYDSVEKLKKLNYVLSIAENKGHAPAPRPTGLKLELFDYQRQATGWCIERENVPNWKHVWALLPYSPTGGEQGPATPARKNNIYFSPALDKFTTSPPASGRGGFICEQMGMGKTIISLSLHLQNPAPLFPCSRMKSVYGKNTYIDKTGRGWGEMEKPESGNRHCGTIFSRGTLVICNVSLVGQWVAEAKVSERSLHAQDKTHTTLTPNNFRTF